MEILLNEIENQYYLNENMIFEKLNLNRKFETKNEELNEIEMAIKNGMSQDEIEKIDEYYNTMNDISILMMKESFKYGFSLANKLLIESLK